MIPVCCGAVTLKCRMCCGCMEQIPECVPGTTPILPNSSDTDVATQSKKTKCCPCRTCCDQPVVNALSFYSNSIIELAQQIQSERQKALQTPIGIAFVTFDTVMQARRVRRDYQPARCVRKPHASVFSERLRSDSWTVDYAPTPNTLIW
ncbi:unnamed protein product [Dibothriocephalus latus]|uniref:CSC1/OSCA1-like cytosolic domain-containing protein n=1 Tax=Dibothriocephalus latus TaxID=60516 RepID=A0A3P6Q1J2_DIBLA|nr:unnamed protein product [Dibothriocephalus latus]